MAGGPSSVGRSPAWLRAVGLFLLVGPASCAEKPSRPPPGGCNLLLISVDTLRADRLNCYGYREREVSPNIDALARDGILFENHISASPWTTPAHISMLTSLYPSAHGVTDSFRELMSHLARGRLFNKLPESVTTLAEVLSANGLVTAAFTAGLALDAKIGFDQGFGRYTSNMYKLNKTNTGKLAHWIKNYRHQRQFIFWHTFEVHAPYLQTTFVDEVLPAETAALLRDRLAEMARRVGGPGLAPREVQRFFERQGIYTRELCEALYLGGVHSFDRWLGRVLGTLRDLGLYDHTLIVLTSDHGEEFADHNPECIYDWHGHTVYEELVRVPLIIKLPRQEHAGLRVAAVSRAVDLMPTVLDVLAIPYAGPGMQGSSLRPRWDGRAAGPPPPAFSESLADPFEKKCVRTDRYKYIVSIDAASVARHGRRYLPAQVKQRELYDLVADPAEANNLLAAPQPEGYAQLVLSLEKGLRELLEVRGPAPEQVQLDAETVENLKALGYVR